MQDPEKNCKCGVRRPLTWSFMVNNIIVAEVKQWLPFDVGLTMYINRIAFAALLGCNLNS